ncbi:152_t:CDS:2 [Entrophospora sp. SA101]|nr:448_t:CDS:2 [Entrophospora sp. SA101]CAJ0852777.1 152_t:CDS:2 [Entrophospora sp. SA101]CAJ0927079.1 16516_t:CDS:2 [Entrophospora sp. SA101]
MSSKRTSTQVIREEQEDGTIIEKTVTTFIEEREEENEPSITTTSATNTSETGIELKNDNGDIITNNDKPESPNKRTSTQVIREVQEDGSIIEKTVVTVIEQNSEERDEERGEEKYEERNEEKYEEKYEKSEPIITTTTTTSATDNSLSDTTKTGTELKSDNGDDNAIINDDDYSEKKIEKIDSTATATNNDNISNDPEKNKVLAETPTHHQRIQFEEREKPDRITPTDQNDNITTDPTIQSSSDAATNNKSKEIPDVDSPKKKHMDIDEHMLNPNEVSKRYSVNINVEKPPESRGLTEGQASKILSEKGPNVLTPPKKKHPFMKYLECLSTLFNVLLIIAGICMYIVFAIDPQDNPSNSYLGAILLGVAFLNAFIEFYQLQKSAAILESFLNLIPQKCYVIRDGKLTQIQASTLVQGDLVFIKMGDKVPADLYLFSVTDMKVDNSSLTGESEAQERTKTNDHENPLEATNLCFNGTLVTSGEGYGIVIRTGDHTVLGQIAGLTAGEDKNRSPLSQEIDNFVKIIATIALSCALIFFGIGMRVYNNQVSLTLSFAISVLVAWVPEGLPATVTVLLTIAAKRMATQNVLVKDLQGVETLGAITLLATDKTGTLTRNQMTVTYIWSALNMYSAFRGVGQNDNLPFDRDAPGIQDIINISILCSRAKFNSTDIPFQEREILGDATETGLIRFAAQNVDDYDDVVNSHPKVFEIPFNSETKWALTIHKKKHENGELVLYIKGAPERVLKLCSTILTDKSAIPLTEVHKRTYDERYEFMASKGHRVLAFAEFLLPRDQYPEDTEFKKEKNNYPLKDLCFVGLVSLEDPPKHGVREAIGRCRTAGIRVMMVTGDHPLTAEAIGRKINLMLSDTKQLMAKRTGRPIESIRDDECNAVVIHGEQIDSLSDMDWESIFAKNEIIFARTSPRHKLEIVKRAQGMGHIVGVTGDGVNDSPALKKADLGIAMNQSGSDVSKEAAAMILMDDNFASTVKGIEEGRLIFANLKKSIRYTISHSTPQVAMSLLYVIVPIPLPLPPILILVTDLGFELFVALSYAWDKPESEKSLMKFPPRKPVTNESIQRLKARKLRRTPTIRDPETGEPVKISRFSSFLYTIKKPFTAEWWSELLESEGGEVLVDLNLLSWSYLEIGTIEAIGAIVSYLVVLNSHGISPYDARNMQNSVTEGGYFTDKASTYTSVYGTELDAAAQKEAVAQAASIVYLGIMIQQMFNLFAVKGRYRLPFGWFIFSNRLNFYGVFGGVVLAMCIVYIPPFNIAFGTSYHLSPLFWLIPMAFGIFILMYASLRILLLRKARPVNLNPEIAGLQMYPTVRSVERKA